MITVYEKPTCTKCREMNKFLVEQGVDFAKVNYYIDPLSEDQLRELLKKMGTQAARASAHERIGLSRTQSWQKRIER